MTFVNMNGIMIGISHLDDFHQIIKKKKTLFDQQQEYMFAYQQILK